MRIPASIRLLILSILIYSCTGTEKEENIQGAGNSPDYAKGFSIIHGPDFSILEVKDPWQGSSGIRFRYLLAKEEELVPDSLRDLPFVEVPVSRLVCMSTTHIAMLDALGMNSAVVGISGSDYISNPEIRHRLETGEVLDVGADQALSYERILSLKPDAVVAYGVSAEINGMVNRLESLGIPVILNADYLENEPLGKTEWLKFLAVFFQLEDKADSIFRHIEGQYLDYKELAGTSNQKPTVMTGLPWKDSWYMPGGNSFAAAFIRDAGGEYLWKDMDSREASPVDMESVVLRASAADFWINSGSARSLMDIGNTDSRMENLRPFREGNVYNNIARLNEHGGNDFWETGVMEPHLILKDLITIFHPDLMDTPELRYYRKLH